MAGSGGAAGTIYWTLALTNRTSKACTLSGTPVAQPLRSRTARIAVGPTAVAMRFAGRGSMVTIKPHATASVILGVGETSNYPVARCAPKKAGAVSATFTRGTSRTRLYFTLPITVCTKLSSTRISGIALGTKSP